MLQERNTIVVALRHSSVLITILDEGSPAVEATEQTVIVSNEVVCHVCQLLINHVTKEDVLRSITLLKP